MSATKLDFDATSLSWLSCGDVTYCFVFIVTLQHCLACQRPQQCTVEMCDITALFRVSLETGYPPQAQPTHQSIKYRNIRILCQKLYENIGGF